MSPRLIAIIRVSKTGERDKLRSPKQQLRAIRRWCQQHGYELLAVYEEIDVSGRKGARNRPALEEAKARVLAGEANGLIAAYVSRFTRNALYGLRLVEQLLDAECKFYALDIPFADLSTPEGRKLLRDKLSDAEYESDVRRGHFLTGVADSIADGVHLGVPFGYRRSNGRGSPLEIDESEAPAVRAAFAMRADGHSWQAIADALNAGPIRPRPYRRDKVEYQPEWTHKTVRGMVVGRKGTGNEVYLGTAWNGEHETPDAHPAIVTPELLGRANRAKGTKPIGPKQGYLLTGLVRCAGCGYSMTHQLLRGRRYYRCRAAQHGNGRCPAPTNVPAEALEENVLSEFMITYNAAARAIENTETVQAAQADVDRAADALKRWFAKLARMDELAPDEQEIVDVQTEDLRTQLRQAKGVLTRAQAATRTADLPEGLTPDGIASMPVPKVRHYLSLVYAAVVVRPAQRYREPVYHRTSILGRDEAPDDSRLIAFIAGRDW